MNRINSVVAILVLSLLAQQDATGQRPNRGPSVSGPIAGFEFDDHVRNGTDTKIDTSSTGAISYSEGLEGRALSLSPGSSLSSVKIAPTNLPFAKDDDFSVQFWVKTTMDSDKPFVILAKKDYKDNSLATQKTAGWAIYSYGGTWAWTVGSKGRRVTHENENGQHMPLNDGKWHQLTMTYNSSTAVTRLYYDGDNKALYKVQDNTGFDFTNNRPLVIGWNGDSGRDTQKPILETINEGARLLQGLVDGFNRLGAGNVETDEIVDLITNAERLFEKKGKQRIAELAEDDRKAFREKLDGANLRSLRDLKSRLGRNPYTTNQNKNFTSISAVAKLYEIEDETVRVRPDVARHYTELTRLYAPDFEMDSLKIWDRVLSTDEVANSYSKHFDSKIPKLEQNIDSLTAACWNIWHGGKHYNLKDDGWDSRIQVAEMLKKRDADVIMMQETYSSGDFIAAELGYYFAASIDWDYLNQGANISVISRYPIKEMFVPETSPFMNCGVKVALSQTQDMYVMSNWYGMGEFENVFNFQKARFAESDKVPTLFAGDFNAVPHTDGGGSPASKVLLDHGFTDAYRSLYPDVEKFKGGTSGHGRGGRIDQIYYKGSGLNNTATDVTSTAEPGFPSDHSLIIAEFDLNYSTHSTREAGGPK